MRLLEEACRKFKAGELSLASGENIKSMLRGEGLKRLESFIFELLMQRALEKYCGDMPAAFGWHVLPLKQKEAGLWIKLQTEDNWGKCDEALLAYLKNRECRVLKIKLAGDRKGLNGCWHIKNDWGEWKELGSLLQEHFGKPSPIKQPKPAPVDRANVALGELFKRLTSQERMSLAISRIMINCFIVPYIKIQPMDLDAVVLNDHKILKILEFKRKYPSSKMKFGVDVHPHAKLIEWLHKTNHKLSNVIFVDPLRNKEGSPLYLLDRSANKNARWLGAHLDPSYFEKETLQTTGRDSGMYDYRREQKSISVERYMDLGTGFSPAKLKAFLNDEPLMATSARQLNEDTANAKRTISTQKI